MSETNVRDKCQRQMPETKRDKCVDKLIQTFSLPKGENILNFIHNREIKLQPNYHEANLKRKNEKKTARKKFSELNQKFKRYCRIKKKSNRNITIARDWVRYLYKVKNRGFHFCDKISAIPELSHNVCDNLISNVRKISKLIRKYRRRIRHNEIKIRVIDEKISKTLGAPDLSSTEPSSSSESDDEDVYNDVSNDDDATTMMQLRNYDDDDNEGNNDNYDDDDNEGSNDNYEDHSVSSVSVSREFTVSSPAYSGYSSRTYDSTTPESGSP